ncbi:gas vesicle protein GvpG [Streptomyces sp. NK08204]|uniref:gas vesicle protein GvpG n=1 Tax=Streptomyces sp. NK08204 TaxID=2873260 RepID=UPI001CED0D8B|nr:gas vesicle protein GvpG [Streptomyces sp. NK08204]
MGLVTQILALPAAPVRGIWWVLDKVVQVAEDEYYDPAPIQEELVTLERARAEGSLDEEEFEQREDQLLQRLEEIRAYQLRKAGQGGP